MTTHTYALMAKTPAGAVRDSSKQAPSATDAVFGLLEVLAGAGLAFMSFLAVIPGLLPAVILGVLLFAPLLLPPLALALAGGLLFGLYRAAACALRASASLVARGAAPRRSAATRVTPHQPHRRAKIAAR